MINGFNAESPYVRGLLDKIGVKPDFITCGEYKSAARDLHAQRPQPGGQADDRLAAGQPLRQLPEDGGQGPRRQARAGPPVGRRGTLYARAGAASWGSSTASSTARTSRPSCGKSSAKT